MVGKTINITSLKDLVFPTPALPGSGFKGIISAETSSAPQQLFLIYLKILFTKLSFCISQN
jgi:hypothetical protein